MMMMAREEDGLTCRKMRIFLFVSSIFTTVDSIPCRHVAVSKFSASSPVRTYANENDWGRYMRRWLIQHQHQHRRLGRGEQQRQRSKEGGQTQGTMASAWGTIRDRPLACVVRRFHQHAHIHMRRCICVFQRCGNTDNNAQ